MSIAFRQTPDCPSAFNGKGIIHTSADELLEAWKQRDQQYARRAIALTPAEVEAIRASREFEAGYVEPRRRGPVYVRARHWRPPTPGEWS